LSARSGLFMEATILKFDVAIARGHGEDVSLAAQIFRGDCDLALGRDRFILKRILRSLHRSKIKMYAPCIFVRVDIRLVLQPSVSMDGIRG
jgi:hypothetical protein